jgi:hypothetical protein
MTAAHFAGASRLPLSLVREYIHADNHLLWALEDLESLAAHGERLLEESARSSQPSPYILRSSVWIMNYAVVESWLAKVARMFMRALELPLAPADLDAKGLRHYSKYLKKVGQVDFPHSGEAWKQLLAIGTVRNAIVHAGGETTQAVENAVREVEHVGTDETESELWLEAGAAPWAIAVSRQFAQDLRSALRISRTDTGEAHNFFDGADG